LVICSSRSSRGREPPRERRGSERTGSKRFARWRTVFLCLLLLWIGCNVRPDRSDVGTDEPNPPSLGGRAMIRSEAGSTRGRGRRIVREVYADPATGIFYGVRWLTPDNKPSVLTTFGIAGSRVLRGRPRTSLRSRAARRGSRVRGVLRRIVAALAAWRGGVREKRSNGAGVWQEVRHRSAPTATGVATFTVSYWFLCIKSTVTSCLAPSYVTR